jgi:hypothetical protein
VAHPRGAAGGAHLRLSDATARLALPCVADIKIGFRTGDDARFGAAHAAKCARKDAETTSHSLGFRLAGMQHWRPRGGSGREATEAEAAHQHDDDSASAAAWECMRAERAWCKALDAAGARAALARFVACGGDGALGAAAARAVLHGARGALAQLRALTAALEAQRECLFFGASVLLLYDAAPLAAAAAEASPHLPHSSPTATVSLDADALRVTLLFVDFAHVLPAGGARDDNTLAGLRALHAALEAAAAGEQC